jgi:hypothetical protein
MLLLFGNVVEIWYIFPRFGILFQEKSGNPEGEAEKGRADLYSRCVASRYRVSITQKIVVANFI